MIPKVTLESSKLTCKVNDEKPIPNLILGEERRREQSLKLLFLGGAFFKQLVRSTDNL